MNAPVESVFTVLLGEAEVRIPCRAAVAAYLEREIFHEHFGEQRLQRGAQKVEQAIEARLEAPAIGAPYQDGIYAGLTIHDNAPHRLILLLGHVDEIDWTAAGEWATRQGGVLPSRVDALVLFQNLKSEFKDAWYWTSEPYARSADYAWFQDFSYGSQSDYHTSYRYRARAVRRVPI